jgi:hypothetical protein
MTSEKFLSKNTRPGVFLCLAGNPRFIAGFFYGGTTLHSFSDGGSQFRA